MLIIVIAKVISKFVTQKLVNYSNIYHLEV